MMAADDEGSAGAAGVKYALRGIDPDLWRRVKVRAANEGRTIRFVILQLLRVYAQHGYHVVETFNEPTDPGRGGQLT